MSVTLRLLAAAVAGLGLTATAPAQDRYILREAGQPDRVVTLEKLQAERLVFAVWYQSGDLDTLAKWKARGVDTVIGPPSVRGVWNTDAFTANAKTAGMTAWLYPSDVPRTGWKTGYPDYPAAADPVPGFPVWMAHPDEPEAADVWIDPATGRPSGSLTADKFSARCEFLRKQSPGTLIFGNFTANQTGYILANGANGNGTVTRADIERMMSGLDWIGVDLYPANTNRSFTQFAYGIKAVRALSGGGKRYFAWVECSDQNLNTAGGRGPTVAEWRAQTWAALILGCKGIGWFPQQIVGLRDDATPADIAAEMPNLVSEIRGHEARLLLPYEPLDLPIPLYGREAGGRRYVVNLSNAPVAHGGRVYGPFEVAISEVAE